VILYRHLAVEPFYVADRSGWTNSVGGLAPPTVGES
jgi:hypothetical protein